MYAKFFGLNTEPFRATPDPATMYFTPGHREALAGISYAIFAHKGFAVLTGEAGTGKTTILSRIVQLSPQSEATFSVILNSSLNSNEFLESVLLDFGIEDIPASKAQRLQKLQKLLLAEYNAGRTCALVIDEAQRLSEDVLEEVRLLSNCELPDQKLLQIVLSGQPELDRILEHDNMRQLRQRIAVRVHLHPLTAAETAEYIQFRWAKAGGADAPPFDPAALSAISEYARRIPRMINILCDSSLLQAFTDASLTVTAEHVDTAARDLMMRRRSGSLSAEHPGFGPAPLELAVSRNGTAARAVEPLPTLRRYAAPPPPQSRISRWAAKLPWTRHADGVI